jgi:hypothetical protein
MSRVSHGTRLRWLVGLGAVVGVIAMLAARHAGSSPVHGPAGARGVASRTGRDAVGPASPGRSASTAPLRGVTAAGSLRLEGQVVDGDKRAVAGARVTIRGGGVVESEADGSFGFDGLAEGRYDVIAERGDRYAEEQNVQLDDTSEPVTLTLVRGPTLVVHVVDHHHRPIAGATVEIGSRKFVTGSDGAARIRGVASDDEYARVSAPGHTGVHDRVVTSDDPADTIEWTAVLDPAADVTGVIVDQIGARVPGGYVELELAGGGRSDSVTADETGAWRLANIGAGAYVARGSSNLHIATADLPVAHDGAHATTGIVVRVQLGGEIAGLVVDSTGRPVGDVQVSAAGGGGDTTDASGRFTVRGLAPGMYTVAASTETLGAARQEVTLVRGQRAELTFVLVPSNIAGVVVDPRGEPVEDAKVIASSDALGSYHITHSDASGRFHLGGLLPGHYQVIARRPGSEVDGPPVEVTTTDRGIELVVSDPAAITGRVVLDGAPVTYFGVAVGDGPDGGWGQPVPVREPDGRFRLFDAPPATQAVVLIGPGFARRVVTGVHVIPGATIDLGDVVVTRGRHLRGRVVDPSGAGVAGATVRVTSSGFSTRETRLRAILRGELWAATDATGSFDLAGLPEVLDGFEIEATHPGHGAFGPRPLAAGATDVTLVLTSPP